MRAETVYAMAVESLKAICLIKYDLKTFDAVLKDPDSFKSVPPFDSLGGLIAKSREEIAQAKAKASGKARFLKAMKSVIKSAKDTNRDNTFGAWTDKNGKQITCDGYRCLRSNEPLEGLPEVPGINISEIVDKAKDDNTVEMKLPTVGEVKARVAELKATKPGIYTGKLAKPVPYDFGEGLPMVNASFLLDMLAAFPDAEVCYISDKPLVTPIYFTGKDGDGVLLPIRKMNKEEN